jgi:hypothetical protein
MCIACEMGFLDMLEALAPEERERLLRQQFGDAAVDAAQAGVKASPFVCEPLNDGTDTPGDERKP